MPYWRVPIYSSYGQLRPKFNHIREKLYLEEKEKRVVFLSCPYQRVSLIRNAKLQIFNTLKKLNMLNKKHYTMKKYLILIVFTVFFISCDNDENAVNINNKASLGVHNLQEYIDNLSNEYSGTEKIVAIEFNFVGNEEIEILKRAELEGISATLALATTKNANQNNLASRGDDCSTKDVSKGKCYQITCHSSNGTSTTSRCTGGAFGTCLKKGSACLDAGGCVEICKVKPRLIFIPKDIIKKEEAGNLDQLIFFPGED